MQRLATYGTLGPGRPNHHVVAGIPGRWRTGWIRGHLHEEGWGATMGFPGLILDENGDRVPVHVLESAVLEEHWDRLDRFEGPGYRRTLATAETPDGVVEAFVYVIRPSAENAGDRPSGHPGPER